MTDKRRTAARKDLAALDLKGQVTAERYAPAITHFVTAASAPMRRGPDVASPIETEVLFGEVFNVYEIKQGWAWGQAGTDRYVGYVEISALVSGTPAPTHRLKALRSYLFPEPDLKSPPKALLSMGSTLAVDGTEGRFSKTREGFIFSGHICPLGHVVEDWVSIAEAFMGTPYLWGGRTSLGLDCSALVQLALQQKGLEAPRDSDQQMDEVGDPVTVEDLTRGDLVFWKGHVAIMVSPTDMVHANATAMAVSRDELSGFAAKIETAEGPIIGCRRIK
ncbi:MAG: peptidoglycan endopeptidase [Alphaproteobacteria bacterium]|nr:MAG: peptidoglycan endopeptidase [Alphaproteobacteria bacterium]